MYAKRQSADQYRARDEQWSSGIRTDMHKSSIWRRLIVAEPSRRDAMRCDVMRPPHNSLEISPARANVPWRLTPVADNDCLLKVYGDPSAMSAEIRAEIYCQLQLSASLSRGPGVSSHRLQQSSANERQSYWHTGQSTESKLSWLKHDFSLGFSSIYKI